MPFQVLLPAAEQFFPLTTGGDKEPEEIKAFLRRRMSEKTLLPALPRPAQIAEERQKEFARLMADAAGQVKMFAVTSEEGRGEGENVTEGMAVTTLLHEERGEEEGEGKTFTTGGLTGGGPLIDGVEQAQGRFIRFVAGQQWRQELGFGSGAQYRSGDAVAKEILQLFAHPRRCRRGD